MTTSRGFSLLALVATLLSVATSSGTLHGNFIKCLHSTPFYSPNTTSYFSILQTSIKNLRFSSSSTRKPLLIVTPLDVRQVQAVVICCRKYEFQLKVLSGGHDLEGLSYTSDVPFIMLDLVNLTSISVNAKQGTAWVEAGANVGELCYRIAQKSSTYGFPAGVSPTVGVGGLFSGGGYGSLMRKYGLSADNIIDARLVNAEGKVFNRKTMGEDLFWAIRGGGAASFGVVLSWKIKLVPVPSTVTILSVDRNLEQGASAIFQKWQYVAHKLPRDLFIQVFVNVVNSTTQDGQRTLVLTFRSLFLGKEEKLIHIMEKYFPELNLKHNDCNETSWIQSVLFFWALPIDGSLDVLLNRTSSLVYSSKAKSDFIKEPISEEGLEGIWKLVLEDNTPQLLITPYGGRMSEIASSATPFPHRKGNIYMILYITYFQYDNGKEAQASREDYSWIRRLYRYMTPFVSKSPRSTYFNYRDLDLGQSKNGTASYSEAKSWGQSYFNDNYDRLVKVKTTVDPNNFFRNEQSIPTCKIQD